MSAGGTRAARQTAALLAAVALVAAADLGVRLARRPAPPEALPSPAAFEADRASFVAIGRPDDALRLERTDAGWRVTRPVDLPADPQEVEALLAELADGVRFELRADDNGEDYARYGLSGGEELTLEVGSPTDELLSLVVGRDAGGGATWVRLPHRPEVYRARIGGRARLDRPAGAWRDRRVLDLDPTRITSVRIDGPRGPALDASRSPSGWRSISGAPIDDPTVDRVVTELAHLRAAAVVEPDRSVAWDGPVVALGTETGPISLRFGHAGGAWTVERRPADGDGAVWRLAEPWLDALGDEATFRDRALWSVGPLRRLTVEGPGLNGIMERTEPAGSTFRILRPGGVDLDPERADGAARFLAAPRVVRWEEISPSEAGFPSNHTWTVTAGDATHTLEIGSTDGDTVWVRALDRPQAIGRLDLRAVRAIETLFGG